MRIAITGASGFVGTAVLEAARRRGHQTVALTRREQAVSGADVTTRIKGIDDEPSVRKALEGAEAVVHLAARVHVMVERSPDALALYERENVEGTRVVLASAIAAGARRFVAMSTAKVHGEGGGTPYVERDPLAPVGPYSSSKREAESCVAESGSGIGWTILRPPLVFGPGVGGNFRRLLALAQLSARVPIPFGALDNRRSIVNVRNLADAALHCLEDPRAIGARYLVSDDEMLSTSDLLRRLGKALGIRPLLVPVPAAILKAVLRTIGRGAEAERLLESFAVDSSRIRRELAWVAPFTVDEGLAETAGWWLARAASEGPR